MKKIFLIISSLLILFLLFLINPQNGKAQGYIYCVNPPSLPDSCAFSSILGMVCEEGYTNPTRCPDFASCCAEQSGSGSCNDVPCILDTSPTITVTPSPTTTIPPPYCEVCVSETSPSICTSLGGSAGSCSGPGGSVGNCCYSGTAGARECDLGTVNCFACTWETATNPAGECTAYEYGNRWVTDFQGCATGYEIIPEKCQSDLTQSDCLGPTRGYICRELYPDAGYFCEVGTNNCVPCDPSNTAVPCNYSNVENCLAACSGSSENFRCDPDDGCVLDSSCDTSNADCFTSGLSCEASGCICTSCNLPDPPSQPMAGDPRCPGQDAIDTAIGCIPVGDPNQFVRYFLRWGMGIGGGIALILIIFAGFQITTSSGDPKRLQAGKELLTAVVMGLALLIFSAFILRLIGSDILGIL